MSRVGLLGGTFDPPHLGHISIAKQVADALDLERIEWVVSGQPPHKPGVDLTDAALRMEMVRAACAADTRFVASSAELDRDGPSYTVDTLRDLVSARPEDSFFLILGADQVESLDSWRQPEEVLDLVRLAVVDRDGTEMTRSWPSVIRALGEDAVGEPGDGARVVRVPTTRVPLSSSGIRQRIGSGERPDGVPPPVATVIQREGLYR